MSKNGQNCHHILQNVSKYPVNVRRSPCVNAIMSDSCASDSPRDDSSKHRLVVLDANKGTTRVALARIDSAFRVSGADHLIFNYCLTFFVVFKCFWANFLRIFFWPKKNNFWVFYRLKKSVNVKKNHKKNYLKYISRCYRMYQNVSRCFWMSEPVSNSLKMSKKVGQCLKMSNIL